MHVWLVGITSQNHIYLDISSCARHSEALSYVYHYYLRLLTNIARTESWAVLVAPRRHRSRVRTSWTAVHVATGTSSSRTRRWSRSWCGCWSWARSRSRSRSWRWCTATTTTDLHISAVVEQLVRLQMRRLPVKLQHTVILTTDLWVLWHVNGHLGWDWWVPLGARRGVQRTHAVVQLTDLLLLVLVRRTHEVHGARTDVVGAVVGAHLDLAGADRDGLEVSIRSEVEAVASLAVGVSGSDVDGVTEGAVDAETHGADGAWDWDDHATVGVDDGRCGGGGGDEDSGDLHGCCLCWCGVVCRSW